jgi:hypothetical protein
MKYDILEMIYTAIDDVNLDQESNMQIEKSLDAVLYGTNSHLDSMGLVNLITIIEQVIEEKTGKYFPIADERAMSLESSPFGSVASLKTYIAQLLDEN